MITQLQEDVHFVFLYDGSYEEFRKRLKKQGETPLPKYIQRPTEPKDKERFQTIYAEHEGSVAAPTAGMHFSKTFVEKIGNKRCRFC